MEYLDLFHFRKVLLYRCKVCFGFHWYHSSIVADLRTAHWVNNTLITVCGSHSVGCSCMLLALNSFVLHLHFRLLVLEDGPVYFIAEHRSQVALLWLSWLIVMNVPIAIFWPWSRGVGIFFQVWLNEHGIRLVPDTPISMDASLIPTCI